METTTIQGFGLWLIPPTLFIAYAAYAVITGKGCFNMNKPDNWGVMPCVVNLLLCTSGALCTHFILGWTEITLAQHVGYIIFEFIGGWVMFAVFYGLGFIGSFKYLIKAKNQAGNFGIDPETLDVGSFVLRQFTDDNWNGKRSINGVTPILYHVCEGKDLSGTHKFFKEYYRLPFEEKSVYTREKLMQVLRDFFDNEKIFTVDKQGVILDVEKKAPEVLVIR